MYLFRLIQICLAIKFDTWTQLSAPEKFDARTELNRFINTGGVQFYYFVSCAPQNISCFVYEGE